MDESHPEFEEYAGRISALNHLMDAAAMIWCSTQNLKESLSASHFEKATVLENTIDPRLWRRYTKDPQTPRATGRIEVLYMGTATHGPDLDMIMPAFHKLSSVYGGLFRLTVIGLVQTHPDPDWLRRIPVPNRPEYPRFARWLRDFAGDFDVGIAPLVDSEFNHVKSDIKILEYTALGLPVIASSVGPYRSLETGSLCESLDDWYNALEVMISDPASLIGERVLVERAERAMWRHRRASQAGEAMLALVDAHARV
jgi:glycosyltransferase involved in cell wall biosynthesis